MREPDLTGTTTRFIRQDEGPAICPVKAWEVDCGPEDAGLAAWLVKGPFHPMWDRWIVSVVHLREEPGIPAPVRSYPEAEYELVVCSVDPDSPELDPPSIAGWKPLMPPDLAFQFHGITELQAVKICRTFIENIVDGTINPDSDFRAHNTRRLKATVEHFREGRHG